MPRRLEHPNGAKDIALAAKSVAQKVQTRAGRHVDERFADARDERCFHLRNTLRNILAVATVARQAGMQAPRLLDQRLRALQVRRRNGAGVYPINPPVRNGLLRVLLHRSQHAQHQCPQQLPTGHFPSLPPALQFAHKDSQWSIIIQEGQQCEVGCAITAARRWRSRWCALDARPPPLFQGMPVGLKTAHRRRRGETYTHILSPHNLHPVSLSLEDQGVEGRAQGQVLDRWHSHGCKADG